MTIPHTPAEHTHEYEPAQIGPTCKHCGLLKSTIEAHTPAEPSDINVTKAKPQVTKALHNTCPTCDGTGLYGYVHGQHMPCTACNGTGTVEPGPPTSPESPQTLGVTAGEITGTDEGGPGTIEAGQGRFVPNNWPGFAWELDFYGAALLPHQRQGILSAHEALIAQREAQAVREFAERVKAKAEAIEDVDGNPVGDADLIHVSVIDAELRATGTERRPDEN